MKIVISKDTFGFCLNDDEIMRYGEIKGIKIIYESVSNQYYIDTINKHNKFYDFQIPRNDPALVQLVEELNVKLPDDVDWIIKKQDSGKEYITEKYKRMWDW
jgi:hypothetical protein